VQRRVYILAADTEEAATVSPPAASPVASVSSPLNEAVDEEEGKLFFAQSAASVCTRVCDRICDYQ